MEVKISNIVRLNNIEVEVSIKQFSALYENQNIIVLIDII